MWDLNFLPIQKTVTHKLVKIFFILPVQHILMYISMKIDGFLAQVYLLHHNYYINKRGTRNVNFT